MVRLGIFGGTFDPPHIAHLCVAAEAAHQLHLDQILWVLTLYPPHKQERSITDLTHRLEMVKAIVDADPNFKLSRVDIDRPPPHYAVDTLRLLQDKYPDAALIYIMGSDSLINLFTWYQPNEFIRRCDGIGVVQRPDFNFNSTDMGQLMPELSHKLEFINTPSMEISATQIRKRIKENRPFRYYLPPMVYKIITERNLYKG